MATFIMLSRLTADGAKAIKKSPSRIQEVNKEFESMRVKVQQQYAVLGAYDFVSIVDAPDLSTVMKASVELAARGSVRVETLAALPVDEFVRALK